MINELVVSSFRKSDDVKIKILTGKSYLKRDTMEIVPELPEDAVLTEWAEIPTGVRDDKTGAIYEIVHVVEDETGPFTEMYLAPDSYSEMSFYTASLGDVSTAILNYDMYPAYKAANTYAAGDIVTYNGMTWISDIDDNTGNQPNLCEWSLYLPYIEKREPHYVTYEELINQA